MTWLTYRRDTCGLCDSRRVDKVVPLTALPCGSPNVGVEGRESERVRETLANLDLYLCADCGHLQLLDIVNPEVQYQGYRYRTGISLGLREHFAGLVDAIAARVSLDRSDLVVEFGSNDGSVLRLMRARGVEVLGVDPAASIARDATISGIPTLPEFFGLDLAREIRRKRGKAKVVIANYVLANINGLNDIANGVRDILREDGLFVIETQYGRDVIEKNLLDTIYHEHISYFNVSPMISFFLKFGLEIFDVERIPTKGGAIRLFIQPAGGPQAVTERCRALARKEAEDGFGRPEVYLAYREGLEGLRRDFEAALARAAPNGRIAGYGASVGSVTLIHYLGLADRLEFIVDDNPVASRLEGPGYGIDVLPRAALEERAPEAVIMFAWRYAKPIVEGNQAYLRNGGSFILPLPTVMVMDGAMERGA